MTKLDDYQQSYIDGLRELTDHLEQHPDLIEGCGLTVYNFGPDDPTQFAALALQLGPSAKSSDDTWYNVSRKFGPHRFQLFTRRDNICQRVVVGSEEIQVEEPDPKAVAALPKIKRTVVTEKVEWICPPSLHELAKGAEEGENPNV